MDATARRSGDGLALALVSASTFGLAGPFGRSLLDAGWSPLAVVLARLTGAALLLAVPLAVVVARGWRPSGRTARTTATYGIVAVAGAQVCYFNAIEHLPVGVALLLEYLAPVLLLVWTSWRARSVPSARTLVGAAIAITGLLLVLDVANGASFDLVGVVWGLGAAVCLSAYYQLSARDDLPPPLVLTAAGMVVGAVAVALVGLAGVLPLVFSGSPTTLGDATLPWWAIVLLLSAVCTATAYVTGISAVTRLGTRLASFVGLTEVLFAILGAWWLVSERPTVQQVVGGILVVAGIVRVRSGEQPVAAPPREEIPGVTVQAEP